MPVRGSLGSGRPIELADLLDQVVEARRQFGGDVEDPAAAEIRAADKELGDRSLADRVIIVADLWTLIACEQLGSIATLLRAGDVYGLFPLARSVIEHSTSVVWLLDPRLGTRDRIVRAGLVMLDSETRMTGIAKRLSGAGTEPYVQQRQRARDLRQSLGTHFGAVSDDGRQLAGQTLPGPSDLVERFGDGWGEPRQWLGIYDYLCATGTHPSLSMYEFIDVTARRSAAIDDDFLERLVRALVVVSIKALEHFVMYCGWTGSSVEETMDAVNQTFGEQVFR